jgi:hypothetical protein
MGVSDSDAFYASVPAFHSFHRLMDPALYTPLPDDWMLGLADVVGSTKAIAQNRYKAVNMAGAAVIAGVKNALGGIDFPYVFGGDGANFAVSGRHIVRICLRDCSHSFSAIGRFAGRALPPRSPRGAGLGTTRLLWPLRLSCIACSCSHTSNCRRVNFEQG